MRRRIVAIAIAVGVNLLVLLGMERSIVPHRGVRLADREIVSLDVVQREMVEPQRREKRRDPIEPKERAAEPQLSDPSKALARSLPAMRLAAPGTGATTLPMDFRPGSLVDGLRIGMGVPGWGDPNALQPVVTVQPVYPPNAANRGIEGRAVVEFSLSPDGSTRDLVVVESEPPGIFDRSCLRSIRRQRYPSPAESGIEPDARLRRECRFELEPRR